MTTEPVERMTKVPTIDQLYEDIEILEETNAIVSNKDLPEPGSPEFASALGLIPRDEIQKRGGVADISDPTALHRLYIAKTGEPRDVPYWAMVGKNSILRRRNEDGTRVFVRVQNPVFTEGKVPCMLHASHPERARFRSYGLIQDCPAGALASYYDQQQHMRLRHRREWATIQENEARDWKLKEEDFRNIQAKAFQQMAETNAMLAQLIKGGVREEELPRQPMTEAEAMAQQAQQPDSGVVDLKKSPSAMNKTELQSLLRARSIDFDPEMTRDQLYELIRG